MSDQRQEIEQYDNDPFFVVLSVLYRALTTIAVPFAATALSFSRRGRIRLGDRFGWYRGVEHITVWFHAASIGEVEGLRPVLTKVREQFPAEKILLTTLSASALSRASEYAHEARILPFDAPWCVSQAVTRMPSLRRAVFSETEIWPGLLMGLHSRGIQCHIINGRISDYTVSRYRMIRRFIAPIVEPIRSFQVCSRGDAARFIELGALPERVEVSGNSKYDREPSLHSLEERNTFAQRLFPCRSHGEPVLVLGSLRPGEEVGWLAAAREVWAEGKALRVVVAPRHQERFAYFADTLRGCGIRFRRWSEAQSLNGAVLGTDEDDAKVVLLDTFGDLEKVYSVANLAFIGATLVDIGGHNPLEACMYGTPVCVGPYISVIKDIVHDLRAVNGILEIRDAGAIPTIVRRLVSFDHTLVEVGQRGHEVWERYRGAAERAVRSIEL